jgi:phosphoribosylanthranilate isomerase
MDSLNRTRIKFCGLTREEDVEAAARLGADAVGFVCYGPSPRYVPRERLGALRRALAPFVTPVLLFVDAELQEIQRAIDEVPDALLQFHGSESPERCEAPGRPYLRAVAVASGGDLLDFEGRYARAAALLADAPSAAFGGSGRTFDWAQLPPPARRAKPLILAGGLDAGNVGAAIRAARPFGVDVSSGIEAQRGVKSEALMRDFVSAVRRADSESSCE